MKSNFLKKWSVIARLLASLSALRQSLTVTMEYWNNSVPRKEETQKKSEYEKKLAFALTKSAALAIEAAMLRNALELVVVDCMDRYICGIAQEALDQCEAAKGPELGRKQIAMQKLLALVAPMEELVRECQDRKPTLRVISACQTALGHYRGALREAAEAPRRSTCPAHRPSLRL